MGSCRFDFSYKQISSVGIEETRFNKEVGSGQGDLAVWYGAGSLRVLGASHIWDAEKDSSPQKVYLSDQLLGEQKVKALDEQDPK